MTLQIADYKKVIDLKDLALTKSDERTQLWMNTSDNLQDRMNKIDDTAKRNEWVFFGLGALTVVAAGFMTARLINR
jgi:hypothetical protein